MIGKLRKSLQPIIDLFAKPFSFVPPNLLTLIGAILGGIVPSYFFLNKMPFWGGLSIIIYLFDALDGSIARITGKVSQFGQFFDSSLDRIIDAALISSIMIAGYVSMVLGLIVLVGSLMVSFLRARAEAAGKGKFKLDVGIAQRADRTILIMLGAIFYRGEVNTPFGQYNLLEIVFAILSVLIWLTVVWRFVASYKALKE